MENRVCKIINDRIIEINPNVNEEKLNMLLECLKGLDNTRGMYVEAINCDIEDDGSLCVRIGTYYAELDNLSHPLYEALDQSNFAEMYTVDKDNEDGAMYVISMNFNGVW